MSSRLATFTSIENRSPITKRLSTAQVFGVPPAAIRMNDNYGALYNASPTDEWCWVIQWQNVDNTTTNSIMGIVITVEYDIEFFKPGSGALPDTLTKEISTAVNDKDELIRLLELKIKLLTS
jgi:hypothetical protein